MIDEESSNVQEDYNQNPNFFSGKTTPAEVENQFKRVKISSPLEQSSNVSSNIGTPGPNGVKLLEVKFN